MGKASGRDFRLPPRADILLSHEPTSSFCRSPCQTCSDGRGGGSWPNGGRLLALVARRLGPRLPRPQVPKAEAAQVEPAQVGAAPPGSSPTSDPESSGLDEGRGGAPFLTGSLRGRGVTGGEGPRVQGPREPGRGVRGVAV